MHGTAIKKSVRSLMVCQFVLPEAWSIIETNCGVFVTSTVKVFISTRILEGNALMSNLIQIYRVISNLKRAEEYDL